MLKNSLPAFIALMFAGVAADSCAALPPMYLGIKDFKLCLSTRESDGYRAWCMPTEKQGNCPAASWAQLKALSGTDKLPDCPANSNLAIPLPADKQSDK